MQGTATDRPAAGVGLAYLHGDGGERVRSTRSYDRGRAHTAMQRCSDAAKQRAVQLSQLRRCIDDTRPRHGVTCTAIEIAPDVPHMAVARASRLTLHA